MKLTRTNVSAAAGRASRRALICKASILINKRDKDLILGQVVLPPRDCRAAFCKRTQPTAEPHIKSSGMLYGAVRSLRRATICTLHDYPCSSSFRIPNAGISAASGSPALSPLTPCCTGLASVMCWNIVLPAAVQICSFQRSRTRHARADHISHFSSIGSWSLLSLIIKDRSISNSGHLRFIGFDRCSDFGAGLGIRCLSALACTLQLGL